PARAGALRRRHRLVKADEVAACHGAKPYDLFVYHLGNSTQHIYMLPLLQRFPGLAELHDLRLGCLAHEARKRGAWPGTLADELRYCGETHLANWLHHGAVTEGALAHLAAQNRRPLERTEAGIVHSARGWR